MDNFYKGKRVLVTGHSGFKGSWLSVWLLMMGAEVHGYSKSLPSQPSMFALLGMEKLVHSRHGDVCDFEQLQRVFSAVKPDIVFHLAAQPLVSKGLTNPLQTFQTNVVGTATVMEAFRLSVGGGIFVNVSSDKCYLNKEWVWGYRENDELGGKDPYSASKAAAELVFNSYYHSFFKQNESPKIASARAGNVIGGGDWGENRIVSDCVKAWMAKREVVLRNPGAIRPWQHVLDAIHGYLLLPVKLHERQDLNGQSFNFGPDLNQHVSVRELVEMMALSFRKSNFECKISIQKPSSSVEAETLKLSTEKSKVLLSWKSVLSLETTVEFTTEWYVGYLQDKKSVFHITQNQISKFRKAHRECNV